MLCPVAAKIIVDFYYKSLFFNLNTPVMLQTVNAVIQRSNFGFQKSSEILKKLLFRTEEKYSDIFFSNHLKSSDDKKIFNHNLNTSFPNFFLSYKSLPSCRWQADLQWNSIYNLQRTWFKMLIEFAICDYMWLYYMIYYIYAGGKLTWNEKVFVLLRIHGKWQLWEKSCVDKKPLKERYSSSLCQSWLNSLYNLKKEKNKLYSFFCVLKSLSFHWPLCCSYKYFKPNDAPDGSRPKIPSSA